MVRSMKWQPRNSKVAIPCNSDNSLTSRPPATYTPNPPGIVNVIPYAVAASCLLAALAHAQTIPNTSTFSVNGTFRDVDGESAASVYIIDDQLDDGYAPGADLFGAPTALLPTAARGNAFFQWGTPGSAEDHSSALWFQRNFSTNVRVENPFDLGFLYFRNGSIADGSGISDFVFEFSLIRPGISLPNNLNPTVVSYGANLLDTPDTGSAAQNADTLVLQESFYETPFVDADGKVYFLKVNFTKPSDGAFTPNATTLSVAEGSVGRVAVTGTLTTVPEPSAAALGLLGALAFFRRRR